VAQRLLNLIIALSAWAGASILDPSRVGVAVLVAQPSTQPPGKDAELQPRSNSGARAALTAAAIAAHIVEESRQAYYATGRPCACPDDVTRGGRRCGATSAYSRPGGARPFCYPLDVPQSRVDEYREKLERAMKGQ
jgi:hypothetical protein